MNYSQCIKGLSIHCICQVIHGLTGAAFKMCLSGEYPNGNVQCPQCNRIFSLKENEEKYLKFCRSRQ